MALALFPADAIDFSTQGLGILRDAESATITEKAQTNGNTTLELSMVYDLGGFLCDRLTAGMLISYNGKQVFEIYGIDDDDDAETRTVSAQHIDYRIMQLPFNDNSHFELTDTPANILASMVKRANVPSSFSVTTDIGGAPIYLTGTFANLSEALAQLLKQVNGEVEHGINSWTLHASRGRSSDVVLRDDKNTTGVTVKTDYTNVINTIVPLTTTGEDKNAVTVAGTPVVSTRTPFNYTRGKTVKMEDGEDPLTYFDRTNADAPSVTADVAVVGGLDLAMFDQVMVFNQALGWTTNIKVIEVDVDPLDDEDPITDVKLGSVQHDLMTAVKAAVDASAEEVTQGYQDADADQQTDIDDAASAASDANDAAGNAQDAADNAADEAAAAKQAASRAQSAADSASSIASSAQQAAQQAASSGASQTAQMEAYRNDIEKQVTDAKDAMMKVVQQNSNGPLIMYGTDGQVATGIPPISSIRSQDGKFTLNNSGLILGDGRVVGSEDGSFYADKLYGETITGTTIVGGTIQGGTISGDVYINSSGSNFNVVMSSQYGYSVSSSNSTVAISDREININGVKLYASKGKLYSTGGFGSA